MVQPARRIDASYREEVALPGGERIVLRAVGAADKELLQRGFDRLSSESRYRRFFTPKRDLSDAELRYFTELDGERHFALAAVVEDEIGREEGVGIARFVFHARSLAVAEPAVAVVDSWQNRGVGGLLCRRLAEAALERGATTFRCVVLASNEPMRALLADLAPDAAVTLEGDAAVVELPVAGLSRAEDAPEPPAARPTPLAKLLALAARGLLVLRGTPGRD